MHMAILKIPKYERESMICRICTLTKNKEEFVINHTTPVKVHYKDICRTCAGAKAKLVNNLKKDNAYPEEGYICPICQKKAKKYYLDHNWSTGDFRGWLCNACNVALGLLKDDPIILNRAIEYLDKLNLSPVCSSQSKHNNRPTNL
jgi:transcription initiation factor IIE alpha subunit